MALLMLRTHDLSWQDHVINIEFMVNPTHNQLLLNKHKTLASKCDKIKRIFDSELKTTKKNMVIDIRMMERRKSALARRKAEIMINKDSKESIKSAFRSHRRNVPKATSLRGQSAPPTFLTELDGSKFDDHERKSNVGSDTSMNSPNYRPKTFNAMQEISPNQSRLSQYQTPPSATRSSARQKSVRFDMELEESNKSEENKEEEKELPERVKDFLKNQIIFNSRPVSDHNEILEKLKLRRLGTGKKSPSPAVAKRYNNTKLEVDILKNAFDNLCVDNSLDNFRRLSSLASRVKTSFRLARNTSMIPLMGTMKANKKFKEKCSSESVL